MSNNGTAAPPAQPAIVDLTMQSMQCVDERKACQERITSLTEALAAEHAKLREINVRHGRIRTLRDREELEGMPAGYREDSGK